MEFLSADTDVFRSAVSTLAISFAMPPEFGLNMHLKYLLQIWTRDNTATEIMDNFHVLYVQFR